MGPPAGPEPGPCGAEWVEVGDGAFLPRLGGAPGAASSARREVGRGQGAAWHRLASAAEDAAWVEGLARRPPLAGLPLLANLRCGAWYVARPGGHCHFKSTDGHYGRWDVPLVRLNLPVARLAAARGGLIVVDATRRGKRFPDALSKTVPLWAAVLNRVAARLCLTAPASAGPDWDLELHTPLWVPAQERAQMEEKLENLVERILGVGEATLREALGGLRRPLRPLWLSQESRLCLAEEDADEGRDECNVREDALKAFTPLYLVSASRVADPHEARVPEGSRWTWDYVQGAGDDAEYWAEGLTPEDYWNNQEFLLGPGPSDLSSRIAEVVSSRVRGGALGRTSAGTHRFAAEGCGEAVPEIVTSDGNGVYWIRGTGLGLGDCTARTILEDDVAVVSCSLQVLSFTCVAKGRIIHLPVRNFKERRGPQLSTALPAALEACQKWLGEGLRVLVVCDDGRDTSVCVAVTLLLSLFSPSTGGELRLDDAFLREPLRAADKSRVRQVLAYVSAAYPPAQASRGMLKQVYEFFREPQGPRNPSVSA